MATVEEAVKFAQLHLENITGQKFPNALDSIATREKMESLVDDPSEIADQLEQADALTLVSRPPESKIYIHFPPHIVKALAKGKVYGWSPVIEEVSHLGYNQFYTTANGFAPQAANIEMISAIDKYILLYSITQAGDKPKVLAEIEDRCFQGAKDPKSCSIEHIVGHQLAQAFIEDFHKLGPNGLATYQQFYALNNWFQMDAMLHDRDPHELFPKKFAEAKAYMKAQFNMDI